MPTRKAVTVMSETVSSLSPIDTAARAQTVWFVAYAVVLFAAAALTVVVWHATSRYQALVKGDADARIAEATLGAAQANERAEVLETSNLILRNDLNEAAGKVAGVQRDAANAQKDAADAKAAQQRVEIALARQRERTAIAERDLERMKPRTISAEQRANLVNMLSAPPKGPVSLSSAGDEANALAHQILEALTAAGWPAGGVTNMMSNQSFPPGVQLSIHDAQAPPPHARALRVALLAVGIPVNEVEEPSVREGVVEILVGTKP